MDWIDISVSIRDGMVHWPDNPPIVVERVMDMAHGDAANVSKISLGVHTGTHVDAPIHFDPKGAAIDKVPLDALCGPARVIAIANPREVTLVELTEANVQGGERILLRTKNSPAAWKQKTFVPDAVHLTLEAANFLAECEVKTVGIDYLSVGGFAAQNGEEVHHVLLEAGIWIIEGLDLTNAPPGPCELMCLPLKIEGADGAPARAFVRPTRGAR
ncbi:MAG TPA: cyclase family protein [Kofleriaceae bacterium]|nr:cyclase family protein [Kofleriaceae bacterium]